MTNTAATRRDIATILAIAFCIRAAVALTFHNIVAPDEVFQALEQAHRLVFGQGIVPWEFQVGLRCWLIPLILAGPMALAHLLTPSPQAGLILIRLLLCAASLSIVWCAARGGDEVSGRQGAWIAGLFAAVWPDLWLMAPHPLEEVLAADCLVPAIYLGNAATAFSKPPVNKSFLLLFFKKAALAAFLLGLAFTLRMQLAPAVAIAGIALCGRNPKTWLLALPIAALPVLAAGGLDWLTWGEPFRSFWLNVYLNVFRDVASQEYGRGPASFFPYIMVLDWLWSLPAMLYLVWRGYDRSKWAVWGALAVIATHSLISHKEYRFIFPALALLVPVAGAGIATLVRDRRPRQAGLLLGGLCLIGPFFSPWIYFNLFWQTHAFSLFNQVAAQQPRLVAFGQWDRVFLPFDILFTGKTSAMALQPYLDGKTPAVPDMIIATTGTFTPPPAFTLETCRPAGWIPFSPNPPQQFCAWSHTAARPPPIAAAPPFEFPFPAAARPFIIRDRLTD